MTLIRTSFLNVIAVSTKILSMLALNKILAIQIGPSGYALVGQLQNAITSMTAIASAGVGTGVTKFTAEYQKRPFKQHQVWIAASFLGFLCSVTVGALVLVFRNELALRLLKDIKFSNFFILVAVCLVLYVFNIFIIAIINGLKDVKLFVIINIINSILTLVITGILASFYGLYGALIALAINQSICCLITIIIIRKKRWFRVENFVGRPDYIATKKLTQFSLMAIVTSVVGPLSLIAVRNMLIVKSGEDAAGYLEAITRISSVYLMIITTPLSVYFLPRLSELEKRDELRKEIINGAKLLIPTAIFLAITIYYFRILIIKILFSQNFTPMEGLFFWQLIGDIVKISAWLFSFFLISRAMVKEFIAIEIVVAISYMALSYLLIPNYGANGVVIAYAINNVIYLILLLIVVYRFFKAIDHNKLSDKG